MGSKLHHLILFLLLAICEIALALPGNTFTGK
jgi:hypothetical protein